MDIRKLYKRKDRLEDRLYYINVEVQERWEKLLGFGCGYFDDWGIRDDIIEVKYEHRGDYGVDKIPIEFFEIPDDEMAKEKYKAYRNKIKKDKRDAEQAEKDLKEKELYKKLKAKFNGSQE